MDNFVNNQSSNNWKLELPEGVNLVDYLYEVLTKEEAIALVRDMNSKLFPGTVLSISPAKPKSQPPIAGPAPIPGPTPVPEPIQAEMPVPEPIQTETPVAGPTVKEEQPAEAPQAEPVPEPAAPVEEPQPEAEAPVEEPAAPVEEPQPEAEAPVEEPVAPMEEAQPEAEAPVEEPAAPVEEPQSDSIFNVDTQASSIPEPVVNPAPAPEPIQAEMPAPEPAAPVEEPQAEAAAPVEEPVAPMEEAQSDSIFNVDTQASSIPEPVVNPAPAPQPMQPQPGSIFGQMPQPTPAPAPQPMPTPMQPQPGSIFGQMPQPTPAPAQQPGPTPIQPQPGSIFGQMPQPTPAPASQPGPTPMQPQPGSIFGQMPQSTPQPAPAPTPVQPQQAPIPEPVFEPKNQDPTMLDDDFMMQTEAPLTAQKIPSFDKGQQGSIFDPMAQTSPSMEPVQPQQDGIFGQPPYKITSPQPVMPQQVNKPAPQMQQSAPGRFVQQYYPEGAASEPVIQQRPEAPQPQQGYIKRTGNTEQLTSDELNKIREANKKDSEPEVQNTSMSEMSLDDLGMFEPRPHLVRERTGEKIYITKDEFKIGKSKVHSDYAIENNTAVSRVHVVVIKRNGVCYMEDNNSTNGTFVDGERLEPGREILLKANMNIIMGDESFIYLLKDEV